MAKKRKGLQILKSVALGALSVVQPIKGLGTGLATAISNEIAENKASETGGEGKFDYVRLGTGLAIVTLVLGYVFGWIDADTFKDLLDSVSELINS